MTDLLSTDIKFVKGIGERLGKLLATTMQIRTIRDLLYTFPTRYVDRSRFRRIAEFKGEMPYVQIRGTFLRFNIEGEGAKRRLTALFSDGERNMEVVWFSRIQQIASTYNTHTIYILFGKPTQFKQSWSVVHPEVDIENINSDRPPLYAVYPISEQARKKNITQRTLRRWIENVLNNPRLQQCSETLPSPLIQQLKLMSLPNALRSIHQPSSDIELEAARHRLKFEELYYIQLHILRFSPQRRADIKGAICPHVGERFNRFYREIIPFDLTEAQKRVVRQIRADLLTGKQMNRLIQGDVGSGKTMVAFMAALLALDNNLQAAIMAPTEILATQHFQTLHPWCLELGINVALLTGSTPQRQRRFLDQALVDGSIQLLIGTHALIEERVQFANLGMAIIDEQHRFGVAQRARLWQKNNIAPHILVMTATPIPRTLAMTLYGDLEVSVIDELPPGRKPIITRLFYQNNKEEMWRLVGSRLRLGQQAYIVYPLISQNEKLDLKSLEEGYQTVQSIFGKQFRIAFVHGKMAAAEKEHQMQLFASGKAAVLVATTVIEVGVNVPNATVMVIESAERFGLAQLHQLRGRVGRGADESYCALVSKTNIGIDTRRRLELMTQTTDGFEIAEADMKMRGPGDIDGTLQSGIPFNLRIAHLTTDTDLMAVARKYADYTLNKYPMLASAKPDADLLLLQKEMTLLFGASDNWSNIS